VENCLFESTGDDMLHINTTTLYPVAKEGRVVTFPQRDIRPGDSLQFYNFFKQKSMGVYRVESVKQQSKEVAVTLERDPGDSVIVATKGLPKKEMYKKFTSVYHLDAACNQFVWRRNICRNGRQKGLLFKGFGGLVEDNTFEHLGGQAFIGINTPLEGFYAREWVFQRNTVIHCGINRIRKSANAILRIERHGGNADFHHENILFRNNVIDGYKDTAVLVEGVDNLVIKDNTFLNSRWKEFKEERFGTQGYYMVFEEGRNIELSGNTVSDIRPLKENGILFKDGAR
jgi:hypothetical protein